MLSVTPINLMIESLTRNEYEILLAHCETVDLVIGEVLCEQGQPFRYVYFPLSGIISLVTSVSAHPPLAIGLIGNEGMLGVKLLLGANISPLRGVVQESGSALRMSAPRLMKMLNKDHGLLRVLNRHLYLLLLQMVQSVACNRFHEVEQRLARWLLMTHDRAQADHFYLTHQYLANMLGVQRSAVTIAAGALQHKLFIRYTRGDIRVLDRKGLESASCECYDAVKKYQSDLIVD